MGPLDNAHTQSPQWTPEISYNFICELYLKKAEKKEKEKCIVDESLILATNEFCVCPLPNAWEFRKGEVECIVTPNFASLFFHLPGLSEGQGSCGLITRGQASSQPATGGP